MSAHHSSSSSASPGSPWETTDWDSDAPYSPSSASSTSSSTSSVETASHVSANRIASARAELAFLERDNRCYAQLASRLAPDNRQRKRWVAPAWTLLCVALALVAVTCLAPVLGRLQHFTLQQQQQAMPSEVDFGSKQDFGTTIRPSDSLALHKIAFHLPARWTDWITTPPLGTSGWQPRLWGCETPDELPGPQRHYCELRRLVGQLESRVYFREQQREAWLKELQETKVWLERIDGQGGRRATHGIDWEWIEEHLWAWSARPPAEDPTRIEQLGQLVNDILVHLVRELMTVEIFIETFASLAIESNARIVAVDTDMYHLAVQVAGRHDPLEVAGRHDSLAGLLSQSEKDEIAHARKEYGILSFLALLSHAMPPAMRQRQADIRKLITRMFGLKQQLSVTNLLPVDQKRRAMAVANGLPSTIAELDAVMKEKSPDARTIRTAAREWMDKHTVESAAKPSPFLSAPFLPCLLRFSRCITTQHPGHLAQQLHSYFWHHPTVGAASWHWEGSGLSTRASLSGKFWLERSLLYAGLDYPEIIDRDHILGKGEQWEDYRFRMFDRGDDANLRLDWPEGYGRQKRYY